MSNEHTPVTEEVRNRYASPYWVNAAQEAERFRAFDRWFNQQLAKAYDQGYEAGWEDGSERQTDIETGFSYKLPNPYEQETT